MSWRRTSSQPKPWPTAPVTAHQVHHSWGCWHSTRQDRQAGRLAQGRGVKGLHTNQHQKSLVAVTMNKKCHQYQQLHTLAVPSFVHLKAGSASVTSSFTCTPIMHVLFLDSQLPCRGRNGGTAVKAAPHSSEGSTAQQ
jgi:hypothetical protein